MVVAQKCLQHESVLAKSVGPEIPAHEVSRGAKLLFDERQRHLGHRGIRELFHGDGLGLLECLADGCREPRLAAGQRVANSDQVHDREDALPPEPIGRGTSWIRIEPADLRMPLLKTGWRPRPDQRVDLAVGEEAGNGCICRRQLDANIRGQMQRDFFAPAGWLFKRREPR